jgi:hypothetical protein
MLNCRFYGLCPSSDQNAIYLPQAVSQFKDGEALLGATCANHFDASKCVAQYSLSQVPGSTVYPPDSLPTWTGTNALSTTGTQLTSLPGGATVTWTGVGGALTATEVPYSAVKGATTGSAIATGTKAGATGTSGATYALPGISAIYTVVLSVLVSLI